MLKILFTRKLSIIILGTLLTILAISSAIPQLSNSSQAAISNWKTNHPVISSIAGPLGFFNAYTSWPFLSALGLLILNMFLCCIRRLFSKEKLASSRKLGSLLFHFSLVVIVGGGLCSFLTRFDAKIILTEEQTALLSRPAFLSFSQGPFAEKQLPSIHMKLAKFTPTYHERKYLVGMSSDLEFLETNGERTLMGISVNNPGEISGYAVTQDRFGFSPRLVISSHGGRKMADAYLALKTFDSGKRKSYADFLTLPITGDKLTVVCFPDFVESNGDYESRSELPDNPYLLLKLEKKDGSLAETKLLRAGEKTAIGNIRILFAGLRYWSAFRLVRDKGIWIMYIGFVLSLLGLFIRYWHEMARFTGWKLRFFT